MFYLPRCIRAVEFSEVVSQQLHVFAVTSDLGYGVTVYVRLINLHGIVHCTLLLSRSRVNPLKKMTIPRLELQESTHCRRWRYLDSSLHQPLLSTHWRRWRYLDSSLQQPQESTHWRWWRYLDSSFKSQTIEDDDDTSTQACSSHCRSQIAQGDCWLQQTARIIIFLDWQHGSALLHLEWMQEISHICIQQSHLN